MPEYVAKVQAAFCPELPICDLKGTREKNEILKTVPEAMKSVNQTVWLEDVSNFLGVFFVYLALALVLVKVVICGKYKNLNKITKI